MRVVIGFLFICLVFCSCVISVNDSDSENTLESNREYQTGSIGFPYLKPRLVPNAADNRLRAAAGAKIITPNPANHPCPYYLGGTSQNRIATSVHDDLEARGILLSYNDEYLFLVSLDLVGVTIGDVQKVMKRLELLGFDRDRVILSSTHTHEGPDTMGIWGVAPFTSGRCPEYIDFLVKTVVHMADDLVDELTPVTVYGASTQMNYPTASNPNLLRDSRFPYVFNENLTTLRFVDDFGQTVSTLVNWQSHPECMIGYKQFSSDFPHWTRMRMEQEYGGVSVYVSGTIGGLINPLHIDIPLYTESGVQVLNQGEPVFTATNNDEKAWSLGYAVAEWAIDSLDGAPDVGDTLVVDSVKVDFPLTNPVMILAVLAGLIETPDGIIRDRPGFCGYYGCFSQNVFHIQLGEVHMFSAPGEAFPELSVGRAEHVRDWGPPWGEHVFPAITGYRELLPPDTLVIDIGLANNETGYITPMADFHTTDHPDFYEEIYFASFRTETLLREALHSMILP